MFVRMSTVDSFNSLKNGQLNWVIKGVSNAYRKV